MHRSGRVLLRRLRVTVTVPGMARTQPQVRYARRLVIATNLVRADHPEAWADAWERAGAQVAEEQRRAARKAARAARTAASSDGRQA